MALDIIIITATTSNSVNIPPNYVVTLNNPLIIPASELNEEMLRAQRLGFVSISQSNLNALPNTDPNTDPNQTPVTPPLPPPTTTPPGTPPGTIPNQIPPVHRPFVVLIPVCNAPPPPLIRQI